MRRSGTRIRYDRNAPRAGLARGAGARRTTPATGQTLVIFALAMVVLFGALGLVLDGGYNYIQRRAMQNTADSAALAGARAIARNMTDAQVTEAVQAAAARNGVTDSSRVICHLITNAYPGGSVQSCSNTGVIMSNLLDQTTGLTAQFTGVLVSVSEAHATFAMPVLGITQSGTGATAAARVEVPVGVAVGPFIVCGIDTVTRSSQPGFSGGIFATDGTHPVTLDNSSPPKQVRVDGYADCDGGLCKKTLETANGPAMNAGVYYYKNAGLEEIKYGSSNGPEFRIHDPSGSNGIARCNNNSAQFKGVNLNAGTITLTDPSGTWSPPDTTKPPITNGNVTSVQATVEGINGCQAGAAINNCIMILPIADNSGPGGTGNNSILAVRTLGAFYIKETSNGRHTGRLIENYTIVSNSQPTFTPGVTTLTTPRLIK